MFLVVFFVRGVFEIAKAEAFFEVGVDFGGDGVFRY